MINEILYILLQKHELPASDPNYTWLMEADTGRLEQLEAAAAAFDCRLLPRQGMIYLIPNQDNLFLGYSKADLKAELLKSNQTDAHYYLSMFALLVLLDAFFSTDYGGGKLRDFLSLDDWMGRFNTALNSGLDAKDNPGNIPYERMVDTYNNLLADPSHKRASNNKAQLFLTLLKFLEKQKLVVYLPDQEQIYLTERMSALMDSILRSDAQLAILRSVESEDE